VTPTEYVPDRRVPGEQWCRRYPGGLGPTGGICVEGQRSPRQKLRGKRSGGNEGFGTSSCERGSDKERGSINGVSDQTDNPDPTA